MIYKPFKHFFCLRIVAVIIICFCCINAFTQHFDIDSNRKRVHMPFRLVRNMVVIEVSINNKGPFNFILDTGVGLMLVTDPALVDTLSIDTKRIVTVPGLGEGEDAEAYITPPLDIAANGIKGYGVSAAILKRDHFNLSNFLGMPIHGLLGYEFFRSLAVEINFSDSTLSVCRPADIRVFRKGEKIPISVEEKKPYMHAKVTFADGTARHSKLVIDLGAGHPVSLENIVQSKGLPLKYIDANLGVGLNGPISGYISRLKQVEIGGYKIKAPLVSLPDGKSNNTKPLISRDGNLGTGILKRFKVIFDYSNSAMYLKKGRGYKAPFEHDMSGMEYFAGGEGHKHIIISRVEPGSPAYEIGLEKYDEIVSINFKPVAQMTLEEIDNIFRSKNDRSILMLVYHDKKYDNVIITLKRRI